MFVQPQARILKSYELYKSLIWAERATAMSVSNKISQIGYNR